MKYNKFGRVKLTKKQALLKRKYLKMGYTHDQFNKNILGINKMTQSANNILLTPIASSSPILKPSIDVNKTIDAIVLPRAIEDSIFVENLYPLKTVDSEILIETTSSGGEILKKQKLQEPEIQPEIKKDEKPILKIGLVIFALIIAGYIVYKSEE